MLQVRKAAQDAVDEYKRQHPNLSEEELKAIEVELPPAPPPAPAPAAAAMAIPGLAQFQANPFGGQYPALPGLDYAAGLLAQQQARVRLQQQQQLQLQQAARQAQQAAHRALNPQQPNLAYQMRMEMHQHAMAAHQQQIDFAIHMGQRAIPGGHGHMPIPAAPAIPPPAPRPARQVGRRHAALPAIHGVPGMLAQAPARRDGQPALEFPRGW